MPAFGHGKFLGLQTLEQIAKHQRLEHLASGWFTDKHICAPITQASYTDFDKKSIAMPNKDIQNDSAHLHDYDIAIIREYLLMDTELAALDSLGLCQYMSLIVTIAFGLIGMGSAIFSMFLNHTNSPGQMIEAYIVTGMLSTIFLPYALPYKSFINKRIDAALG